jgi:gentisate 1,2-dioxygenase
MKFILADGTMHAHSSEMPVGTYKKAHRHGADFHVYSVTGSGYSLLWYEGDADFERVDWRHGVVFAPPDGMYHQHYNTSNEPARYLAVALGSLRYPFTTEKMNVFAGADVDVKDGGRQIEYEDQDPRVHEIYLEELAKNGVESKMGDYVDESALKKKTA